MSEAYRKQDHSIPYANGVATNKSLHTLRKCSFMNTTDINKGKGCIIKL